MRAEGKAVSHPVQLVATVLPADDAMVQMLCEQMIVALDQAVSMTVHPQVIEALLARLADANWHPVMPLGEALETRRDGESGANLCSATVAGQTDELEWIELATGRTTVTHHSFAAPTHWRRIEAKEQGT